ncbi:heparin lyase I family protein [Streptomyces sp. CAU 1734]|uniref:heparin lyase I family protein n=1 Tax=Streptomyces sp. CAU 1734 TaxID=3140360 RepID=UPI0032600B38
MRVRTGIAGTLAAGAMTMTLLAAQAHAAVIWNAEALSDPDRVFENVGSNCSDTGNSVTAVQDSAARGMVWRYEKASGSNRCESKGVATNNVNYVFQNGTTRFFGWESRLSSAVDNHAVFQWKSNTDGAQNWPVVLKMVGGHLTMLQRQPNAAEQTIWTSPAPVGANSWNRIAVGMKFSDTVDGGWVQLWFNGVRQTFKQGTPESTQHWKCQTWDTPGGGNKPKWGVYGAKDHSVIHSINDLKMGNTVEDVD